MKNLAVRIIAILILTSLAVSPVLAQAPIQSTPDHIPPTFETPSRPEPELVSQEILDLFKDGIPIEEFLAMNKGPIPNALLEYANLPVTVIIQLEEPGLIMQMQKPGVQVVQPQYIDQLEIAQQSIIDQMSSRGIDAVVMGRYTKVLNGFMAQVAYKDLAAIRSLPGVKSVTKAPEHEINLAYSAPLTRTDLVWQYGETGYTGKGITVAVIDTGIDYTHAMFGTMGDPEAYAANDPNLIEPGSFPTPKVIGGWDFAGTNYDAGGTYGSPVPVPDPDPLDEGGHGTHVSSTVAGIDAGYGSGMAPDAKLYALKVFGANGSTNLVIDAIEWAMDPNGDGYIEDHVDVINMSLGSSFGPAIKDDPEYLAVEAANAAGVMVVASAGNAGNNSYITGSPGNTDSALAVAASTTGFETLPFISYNSGADKIPYTTSYNPFTETITTDLVDVDSLDGSGVGQLCSTAGVGDMTGKIALIVRGTCSFYIKVNNAEALGAVGAIIYNNTTGVISMDTTGSTLPAGSILQSDGLLLKSLAPIMVSVGPDSNVETWVSAAPADTLASFSSRGPRGFDSMMKPEITAPGVAIFAANMGSGNQGVSMSGTSMASPHVAGIAALIKEAHPNWTNEQIKAALMNTAVDLADPSSARIPLQGAGRVDALAAVTTDVIAIADSKFVSMNWGVIKVTEDTFTSVKTVTLRNFSNEEVTLDVGSLFTSVNTGATLTAGVESVTIPAYGKAIVEFTLDLDMTLMPIDFVQMEEYYGYVTFSGEAANLRVPFYFVPRPFTEMTELDSDTDIELEDTGWVEFEQSGPVASSLWSFPVTMVSDNDPDVIDMADLRYVGMDYGGSSPYGAIIQAGFAMWGDQHTPQPYWSEVDLWVYGDMPEPVVNFNYNYGWYMGTGINNQWIVAQVDYNDGNIYLGSPYSIYADYNSGFMEWYLPAPWQYVTDEFDYEVVSYDWYGTYDYAGAASYDITKPPMLWGLTDDAPFNSSSSLLFMVDDADGYVLSQPQGMMLVDYYGKPGVGQAYFWPVRIVEPPKINEFSVNHVGTDTEEYLEIIGSPNTDYSNYAVLSIEGDYNSSDSSEGFIDRIVPVGTTDANGLFLAELPDDALENGTMTLLLVKDNTGVTGNDIDTDDDGKIDNTSYWSAIADEVAIHDGDASDLTYATPVLGVNYDGLSSFAPGGASRIPDGFDINSASDWVRNDFDLAGITGFVGTPIYGEAYNTPGEFNKIVPFIVYLPIILK